MNEQHDPNNPPHMLWRPHVPSPYVTHQDLAPMHNKIGSLEQGQQAIVSSYNHIRGEMLHGFDEIKAILRAQQETAQPPTESKGVVTLGRGELMALIGALIGVGALLGRPVLTAFGLN